MHLTRNTRGWRGVGTALAAAAVLIAGSACSSSSSSNPAGSPSASGAKPTGTVSLWHYYGDETTPTGKPFYALAEQCEAANPGIKVDLRFIPYGDFNRTLFQSAASGSQPDIALINAFDTAAMAEGGVIQDITDRVTAWGEADKYYPTGWETAQVDGKSYGIPHLADAYAIYYNKKLLADAGVQPPTTWDEMAATAKTLATGGRSGLAVSGIEGAEGATGYVIRLLAAGGSVDKPGDAAGVKSLQQFKDMTASGAISPGFITWGEEDAKNQFAQGKAAMMINSATYVSILPKESPNLDWDVALLPKDQSGQTVLGAENLAIGADSENADAAWEIIKCMQQPDLLATYLPDRNKLPARNDVTSSGEDPRRSKFAQQLQEAWAPEGTIAAKSGEIFTALQAALQAVVSGAATPEQAAQQAQEAVDEALGQ